MNIYAKILIFRALIFFIGILFLFLDIEAKQFDAVNASIYCTLLGYWIIDVISISHNEYGGGSLTSKALTKIENKQLNSDIRKAILMGRIRKIDNQEPKYTIEEIIDSVFKKD